MFSNRKIVLLIVLLVTLSLTAYIVVVVIPSKLAEKSYEGAKQIGRDIAGIFHVTPQVTVNNTVVLQQLTPILELATVSQKFQHHYEWTNTFLRSTKKINITGTFEAKAGFDMNNRFSIDITDTKAVVTLPHPKLLSIEGLNDVKFTDENGIWNWVHAEDRSSAMNAFTGDARKYAAQASFVADAQKQMEDKLRLILKQHGKEMEVRYEDAPSLHTQDR
ncbi:DUF4230 domain-containing protein [Chryseolinea lacunae]|uniref:DUF4230 domain-containing protein n=1 Tax=Chryseolinea lacunae TaxID=2801331 RepID=A0ABS1KRS0_9BACT|nr:DUF4230 domain-containing protein [Chryseolinea lacunae]MBL0742121.1 DUF4230 domain-containing protein [Chryseolinea lacunae]